MSPVGKASTIRDLIDQMAALQVGQPFIISPETGRTITYDGLRRQLLNVSGYFRELGLSPGDKIGLLTDNGLSAIQLFLGAMYSGLVCVPLNVRAGLTHLSFMLNDCDANVIFVADSYNKLSEQALTDVQRPIRVVAANIDDWPEAADLSLMLGDLSPISSEDPALLIYSSGSTGLPKGAVHSHRSVLAHGRNAAQSHELTAADRSLLVLPLYHINAECVTLMPTLTCGGSVVVPRGFLVNEFWNWLDDYRCTWSAVVPTIISQLLDWKDPRAHERTRMFERIRFLRTSSAPLSPALHREFADKFNLLLIQAMGSSEGGNVFSNPLPPRKNKIGSPGLPWGFETKIVSRDGAEVQAGEPGEVLLRGDGMMQCYHNDPDGTKAALDSDNWLHTGDLAFQDEDGYFFVVGRSKELIIKGGMNIAPKQIDEVLESHPTILEAAAVGVPDRYLGEDVVAFAVLRDGMSCEERELLSFCEERLGHFKTPTRVHFIADLPKGPSGKVQRLHLLEGFDRSGTGQSNLAAHTYAAGGIQNPQYQPNLPLEEIITGVWSDVLGQPGIGPDNNFFSLGGHSLLAIQCLSRLRERVPLILSLSDFFENPTVSQQAALIRKRLISADARRSGANGQVTGNVDAIPLRDRTQPCPLSPAQERLWFLGQLIPDAPVYNEAEAVRLKGNLDIAALERAFNLIIARHEILRATIEVRDERPIALVRESWPAKFKRINVCHLPADQREAELARHLVDEPRRPYLLGAEPGIRATVVELAADEHAFILMMHHIVCDSSSLGIIWRELGTLYVACQQKRPSPLEPLPIQFGDYAAWQRQPRRKTDFEADLAFWRETLNGAPTLLQLPTDRPRPPVNSYRGTKRVFSFDAELAESLRRFSRREQTSLFTVFAAGLNALLYRYTGQDNILVGIPIADRDRPEIQPLVGFLIDTHVLRTDLSGNPVFRELMSRVQRGVAGVYSHRAAPFDEVVNAVRPERNLSYSPLFQVMLNWRDRDDQPQFIPFPGLIAEGLLAQSSISKFDLTLVVTDATDGILLEIEYSTDLFDDARIERMVGHLRTLLEGAAANPEQKIEEMQILTSAERHQLLVEWNAHQDDQVA